jgi:DNA-binding MarR family transcriptional regulator
MLLVLALDAPAGIVYAHAMATRPIGYWLKELDRLLEQSFAQALASEHCSRRHWQLLNVLEAGPASEAGLESAVAPFAATDAEGVRAALTDLVERGWAESLAGARVQLTAAGREAHRKLEATVAEQRRHIAQGVSEEDYRTAVSVLERMASNLQTFLGAPPRRG